jgi:hypothetical protein
MSCTIIDGRGVIPCPCGGNIEACMCGQGGERDCPGCRACQDPEDFDEYGRALDDFDDDWAAE